MCHGQPSFPDGQQRGPVPRPGSIPLPIRAQASQLWALFWPRLGWEASIDLDPKYLCVVLQRPLNLGPLRPLLPAGHRVPAPGAEASAGLLRTRRRWFRCCPQADSAWPAAVRQWHFVAWSGVMRQGSRPCPSLAYPRAEDIRTGSDRGLGGSRGASEGDFPQTHLQIPQSWTGRQRGSQGCLLSALCNTAGVRCPPARTGAALGGQVAAWGSCLLSGPLIASAAPRAEGPRQKRRQGRVSHWDARSLCLPRPVTSLKAGSRDQGGAKSPEVQAPLGNHRRVQSSGSPPALPSPGLCHSALVEEKRFWRPLPGLQHWAAPPPGAPRMRSQVGPQKGAAHSRGRRGS